jgi:hypothetical protein
LCDTHERLHIQNETLAGAHPTRLLCLTLTQLTTWLNREQECDSRRDPHLERNNRHTIYRRLHNRTNSEAATNRDRIIFGRNNQFKR